MSRKALSAAAAGLGMLLVAGGGVANAEPSGTPTYRQLVGVGSDTTQSVLNGLSGVVVDGAGTKLLGSYDAVGASTVTTKDPAVNANCTFTRPVGSGAGRTALAASVLGQSYGGSSNLSGCVEFARSSSYSSAVYGTAGSQLLTYIPFATDAVTFATLATSNVPRKLTVAQLTSIYQCTFGAPQSIKPQLPQANSGTREFFLSKIGLSSSATIPPNNPDGSVAVGTGTGLGSCVTDKATDGTTPIVENDGTFLVNGNSIMPFSTGQFIAQISGQQTNSLGRAALGAIGTVAGTFNSSLYINPTAGGASFPFTRDVYNVVPSGMVTDPTYAGIFVGAGSQVCQAAATIQKYGFNVSPICGDTSKKSG